MAKERLPEAKVTVKLELNEAEECLKHLPPEFEELRIRFEEAIEQAKFWNFLRNCQYLEFEQADFHFTGLGTPGWHLYCTHPENKGRPVYIADLPKEVKDRVTSGCDEKNCPIKNLLPETGI